LLVKGYAGFGVLILVLFFLACQDGRQMIDPFGISPSRPTGPGQVHK